MIRVADCLVQTHDLRLVLLAAIVCMVASATAFRLKPRIVAEPESQSAIVWLALTSAVAGSGVWATHFIAMLAFRPPFPTAYEPATTAASFVVSIVVTVCAFALLRLVPGRAGSVAAGGLLGLSTVAMHYTGIAGMRFAGTVVLDPAVVALSAALSIAFAAPALLVSVRGTRPTHWIVGSVLFVLSIVSLHFTGMAAITLVPDPSITIPDDLLSGSWLGASIGIVTLVIAGSSLTVWAIDRRSRSESDRRMRFLARHDTLTSLPNRLLFEEVVTREISGGSGTGRAAAILCIDLDGFKEVNDIFGHASGDKLLVEVSRRLQALLGERCVAARLGGDEFAILAMGLGREKTPEIAAQATLAALSAPFDIEGSRVDIGCSIGISVFPQDGTSYPVLLSNADVALNRAKSAGKGMFRFFEPAMDAAIRERRRLAQDLRAAIGTPQLRLEYQAQLDLPTNRIAGFEALLRWDHPVRGPISPAVFIPIAEETGLILPIGEWVLRTACREAARWQVPLFIAVNVSVAQFRQAGLVDLVRGVLDETGLAATRLELEVTESLFLDSTPRSLQTLHDIKSFGVQITMDDFGTGFSSLSTLQSFQFDKLKIDRSFTAQLGQTTKGTAIVKAILALGDSLGMQVVAEGVETEDQLRFLRNQHCSEVQGYLLGRPAPIAAYEDILSPARPLANVLRLNPGGGKRRVDEAA